MKRFALFGIVGALVLLWSGGVYAASATGVVTMVGGKPSHTSWGTVCYKFTFVTDSTGTGATDTLGGNDYSNLAMKSPWAEVPIGIPFAIFIETADADSTVAWGADGTNADTVGISLETAPPVGLGVDSASSSTKFEKVTKLWTMRSAVWTAFTMQKYFPMVVADTLNDTGIVAAGGPIPGTMVSIPAINLGKMRFSLTLREDNDTVCDSRIRLNCYIVFQDPIPKEKRFGYIPDYVDPTYAVWEKAIPYDYAWAREHTPAMYWRNRQLGITRNG